MRNGLRIIAALLVFVAVSAAIIYFFLVPTTLRLAVGPAAGLDYRVAAGFQQALQRERSSIRLKLITTDGAATSAEVFRQGRSDLAIIRSDGSLPPQAMTIAIVRTEAVYFIVNPSSTIKTISDFKGKSIGIIGQRPANEALLRRMLEQNSVLISDVTLVKGNVGEVIEAARGQKVDAIFVVSPIGDRFGRQVYSAFARQGQAEPEFLPISDARSMAIEHAGFDAIDIPAETFSTDPSVPDEDTKTLAVSHRLVAARAMRDGTASELTKALFRLRLAIAAETPAANQLELPTTTDRGSRLPVHPGTLAYVDGETATFLADYGEWVYVGIVALSFIGSLIAAFWSRVTSGRDPVNIKREIADLVRLIEMAKGAGNIEELESAEAESDKVRTHLSSAMIANEPDSDRIAAIQFLITELESAITRKRAALAPAR